MRHRILVLDPGHFHAALLFSRSSPRVDPVIHVHAPPGPDVEAFIALIDGFNNRNIDPTSWRLESHIGVKALDTLIAERHGEIVVLAGKNGLRLPIMHRLPAREAPVPSNERLAEGQSEFTYTMPRKPSIAVLPFDNLSGDPSQDYIDDGLTETIIAELAKFPDLSIIARNSTFTFKNNAVLVQEVAENLGTRYVLEGSIQIAGD